MNASIFTQAIGLKFHISSTKNLAALPYAIYPEDPAPMPPHPPLRAALLPRSKGHRPAAQIAVRVLSCAMAVSAVLCTGTATASDAFNPASDLEAQNIKLNARLETLEKKLVEQAPKNGQNGPKTGNTPAIDGIPLPSLPKPLFGPSSLTNSKPEPPPEKVLGVFNGREIYAKDGAVLDRPLRRSQQQAKGAK